MVLFGRAKQVTISFNHFDKSRPVLGEMAKNLVLPQTSSPVALVTIAHADDLLLFCGATVIHLVSNGWQVHVIRVTDDRWDSWGISENESIERNQNEFRDAMNSIGVASITELGYPTDLLGDRSEVELRKSLMDNIRRVRPYLVMTFDPDSLLHEDNEDHKLVARAMTEAAWTSGFDKHPGSAYEVINPHVPIERWFFGRRVAEVTHIVEIEPYVDQLVIAIAKHQTMLINMAHQLDLQANFLGYSLDKLIHIAEITPEEFARMILAGRSNEELRVVGPERILDAIERFGEPL